MHLNCLLYYITGTGVLIMHILELNMVPYGFKFANALHHIVMNIGGRLRGGANCYYTWCSVVLLPQPRFVRSSLHGITQ